MEHLPLGHSPALPGPPRRDPPGANGASNVIVFRPHPRPSYHLSPRDRVDIADWRTLAGAHGYDRLVIHERVEGDPPDLDSFLSIYRRGESWASWSLARAGGLVLAWSSSTGADIGRFASISEALATLLGVAADPCRPHAPVEFSSLRASPA